MHITVGWLLLCLSFGFVLSYNHHSRYNNRNNRNYRVSRAVKCPGILISGGMKDGRISNALYMYHPATARIQPIRSTLLRASINHISATYPGGYALFAAGGTRESGYQTKPELLNLRNGKMTKAAELDIPRYEAASTVLNYDTWLCGGNDDNNKDLRSCEVFTAAQCWERGASMIEARSALAMASAGKHIYAIGGYQWNGRNRTVLNSVEEYSEEQSRWRFVPSMKRRREYAAAAEYNSCLFVCGGTGISTHLDYNDCEYYNPETRRWNSDIARMHSRRQVFSLVRYNDKLYAIGPDSIESYHPPRNKWQEERVSFPVSSGASAVALINC